MSNFDQRSMQADTPYASARDEQVAREQAEVDAQLLGRSDAAQSRAEQPRAAQWAGQQETGQRWDQHAGAQPAYAAPDPAIRVAPGDAEPSPFASANRDAATVQAPAGSQSTSAGPQPTRARRSGWVRLGGTAAAAALLASLGTATVTGAFEAPANEPVAASGAQAIPASSTATDPDWQAVAAAVGESVVALDVATPSGAGAGSGVIIDSGGHILTNSHVVNGASSVVVTLADGQLHEAEIVGQDETTDLAVVRLVDPPAGLVPATLGSSADLAVGEAVLAVGNPLGLDSTSTTGIVSALDRPVVTQSQTQSVVTNAIQIDAAINPGNSGGPLFDAQGEVIGINSSIATLSGGAPAGSIGLGFAIPVDQAADVAQQLIEDGQVEHAFLGLSLGEATATVDGVTRQGAQVHQLEPGSPADAAGLRPGDVVTAIDGRSVDSAASLTGYVRQYTSGERATLSVARDGESQEVDVTLAVREQLSV